MKKKADFAIKQVKRTYLRNLFFYYQSYCGAQSVDELDQLYDYVYDDNAEADLIDIGHRLVGAQRYCNKRFRDALHAKGFGHLTPRG